MRFLTFCLAALVIFTGCYIDEQSLYGQWQAAAFYENNQPSDAPLDSVSLSFSENGAYHFTSIGYYREQGVYRTSMHYLLLTDQTTDPAREYILKIIELSADTLTLGMEHEGKEQRLVLARRK